MQVPPRRVGPGVRGGDPGGARPARGGPPPPRLGPGGGGGAGGGAPPPPPRRGPASGQRPAHLDRGAPAVVLDPDLVGQPVDDREPAAAPAGVGRRGAPLAVV